MLWRGQEATELIVILALIAVAGLLIYSYSQTAIAQSSEDVIISQARTSVNDLATAATQAYSEGVGAKRLVYITIPEGAVSSRVYVRNNIINIGVRIGSNLTDINTQTSMKLFQGSDFPTTPGIYLVPVTSGPGYVLIGNSYLLINPSSLSVTMNPSSSSNNTIVFTNLLSTPVNVTLSTQWIYASTVNLTVNNNVTSFILNSSGNGNSTSIWVNFTTYSFTPLQIYSGSIGVSTNTSQTANISLSVNVGGTQFSTGVSYITIDTFKDSAYSIPTANFTLPYNGTLSGSGWSPGLVTINVIGPWGGSATGYPTQLTANSTGGFTYSFNPAGLPAGAYTVSANQTSSSKNATYSFSITACS